MYDGIKVFAIFGDTIPLNKKLNEMFIEN